MSQRPDYAFSPSLLDAYQRMVDTKVEDFFYQDEAGAWHLNWNESEETLHYSEEEVDALLKQEFIDYVNKVPKPPSEAASKGTAFNEIIDCLVMKRKPNDGIVIKTIRNGKDLFDVRPKPELLHVDGKEMVDAKAIRDTSHSHTWVALPSRASLSLRNRIRNSREPSNDQTTKIR